VKELIEKYWNDPVWSKVIASGLIVLLPLLGIKIISLLSKIPFLEILSFGIPLYWIFIAILVYRVLGYITFRKADSISVHERVRDELVKFNEKGLILFCGGGR